MCVCVNVVFCLWCAFVVCLCGVPMICILVTSSIICLKKKAQDRCHRLGQIKPVTVYRFLCRHTYEAEMFRRACAKLKQDKLVMTSITHVVRKTTDKQDAKSDLRGVDGKEVSTTTKQKKNKQADESFATHWDRTELEAILKSGAYGILGTDNNKDDDDDNATNHDKRDTKHENEEDIEAILKRSARICCVAADHKQKDSASFSKAVFVPKDASGEMVALDDPHFWTKIGLVQSVQKKEDEPILAESKRQRKQISRFNPSASVSRGSDNNDDNEKCDSTPADMDDEGTIIHHTRQEEKERKTERGRKKKDGCAHFYMHFCMFSVM